MKLKLLLLLSIFALCGCSAAVDTSVSEITVAPSPTVSPTPSPTVSSTPIPTESSSLEDRFNEIVARAEEPAKSATKITEGPLYDSIVSVDPNVSLYEIGDSLSVSIYLTHDTVNSDAINFFDTIVSIIKECNIESFYSCVDFSMFVDQKIVCTFVLTDYVSPASFSCTKPVVLVDDYDFIISTIYSSVFSPYDISNLRR